MVKKFEGRPFALIGINSDSQDRSVLKRRLAEQSITWTQVLDGQRGPICTKWNVRVFPTVYLIDHEGVIRNNSLYGDAVDAAVEELLAGVKQQAAGN